jgi:hypothetical protein
VAVADQDDAGRQRKGRQEALALARSADRVIVARGKKTVAFDMKHNPPDDDTLAAHLLGPTGNLRAPTVRRGRTLLVGFSEQAYRQAITGSLR